MRTIGVSLAIPEPWGGQLQAWRASFGDPLARAIPTHVTLLPPTEVEDASLDAIEAHLLGVAARERAFPMILRGTGTFRPTSPVVFIQVARGIPDCERLEQAVRSGPLLRGLHFPYHPHVTVAHHLPDPVLDRAFDKLSGYEASFEVRGFSLYEHGDDEVWRPRRAFPFGG
ncbi:2'-5' RNA ligase family protein [Yinghuangia soli]|uniref:2'-5' RNA ligase family protein n=1 Tax=Yinghuangia soli TaxID=2908204 RepID=A0AA41Q1V3_9ACTN|nr:2'-5' RNA ligase family protein [Yinghuangia soli]MCF2530014.1 2'-5' RNA ligase family protein [Yinghuangia soli]